MQNDEEISDLTEADSIESQNEDRDVCAEFVTSFTKSLRFRVKGTQIETIKKYQTILHIISTEPKNAAQIVADFGPNSGLTASTISPLLSVLARQGVIDLIKVPKISPSGNTLQHPETKYVQNAHTTHVANQMPNVLAEIENTQAPPKKLKTARPRQYPGFLD